MTRHIATYLRNNVLGLLGLSFSIEMGTAWAADKLAKNSVGTKQLKNNSVTSAKVADGSSEARSFANGSGSTTRWKT